MLLVVNNMLNVIGLITVNPFIAYNSTPIKFRHVISYTANTFHRIIIWRLTSLLNRLSQIDNLLFDYKKQLMSCTVCLCLSKRQIRAEKRKKKIRYNN